MLLGEIYGIDGGSTSSDEVVPMDDVPDLVAESDVDSSSDDDEDLDFAIGNGDIDVDSNIPSLSLSFAANESAISFAAADNGEDSDMHLSLEIDPDPPLLIPPACGAVVLGADAIEGPGDEAPEESHPIRAPRAAGDVSSDHVGEEEALAEEASDFEELLLQIAGEANSKNAIQLVFTNLILNELQCSQAKGSMVLRAIRLMKSISPERFGWSMLLIIS